MKNFSKFSSFLYISMFTLILSANSIFAASKILAVNPKPQYQENWGRFLTEFSKLGIEVEQSEELKDNLFDYQLVALAVSTKEIDNTEGLFEWVKKGNKLVTVFLNDSWVNKDFFPYDIKFSDADPADIIFIKEDSLLITGLGGKKFRGKAADVPVEFDENNYQVLAATEQGHPAVLKADYGKGSFLILQFHTGLSHNLKLMGQLVKNIAAWSDLETQTKEYAKDPFERAGDHAALTARQTMAYNWGEGVFMYGLLDAYSHFKKPEYLEAVKDWADLHTQPERLADVLDRRAYCGIWGPGTPTVMLYGITGDKKYLSATKQIWEYIRDEATRTEEGALGHYRNNYQIWDDTLFMACPTLTKYYKYTGNEAALEDAILQLVLAQKHLQCKWTDLFFHMWDSTDGKTNPDFWGRGNGWVIMSIVDTLEYTPKSHEHYDFLKQVLQKQIKALMKYQAPSGMWRTVVNRPDSYEETSATAMIVYGVAKAMQLDLVEQDYTNELQKAWQALENQVNEQGVVLGTSSGTGPTYYEGYMTRPTGEYTWGTGSFLMAGAKLHEMGLIPEKKKNVNIDYDLIFHEDGKVNLGLVRDQLTALIDEMMVKPGPYGVYKLRKTGEPELYATVDYAISRVVMGENLMVTLSPKQRQQWADHINSYAKPDGSYISGYMGHSLQHRNGMVIGALGSIGGKQKYPVLLYSEFDEEDEVVGWLEAIDWRRQWGASHLFWGGMHCFSMSKKCTDQWREVVFGWLNSNLDPQTGWWKKGVPTSFANHLGGACHIWPVYQHNDRVFPYPKKVIDSILENQREDGSWLSSFGNYLDLDALYGLCYMRSLAPGYRENEIEQAVENFVVFFKKHYPELAERPTVNAHQVLSMAGTAGLLNQLYPEKYYDTVQWTDIFSDRNLYLTNRVEVFNEDEPEYGEPILYRQIDIRKQYLAREKVNNKTISYGGDVRIGDLNNDGKADFVIFRAKEINGKLSSKPCFIGAVDMNAARMWSVGKGGSQVQRPGPVAVYDIDADGVTEVVTFFKDADKQAPQTSMEDMVIKILDGRNGKLKKQAAPKEFTSTTGSGANWFHQRILIANFRGNKTPQDFICKLGTKYIAFDNELNVLWTYESPWSKYSQCPAYIPSVGDIDGDGKDEVNGGYQLIDDDGSVMWEEKLASNMDSVAIDEWDNNRMRAFCSGYGHVMDEEGNSILELGKEEVPHGQELRVGNLSAKHPGNEMVIRYLGHKPHIMIVSNKGDILNKFKLNQSPNNTGMEVVNWFGKDKEALIYNNGVLWRANGQKVADLPHLPQAQGESRMGWYHCIAANICGDDREEVVLYNPWDMFVWIYTPAPTVHKQYQGYNPKPKQYNARIMD